MSFSKLKKSSGTEHLISEMNKMATKGKDSYKDDRYWKPERDKSGNGYAVIRFLPTCEGEDLPWVRIFSHGFKGKGGWLIDNCATTLGEKCPVCEANSLLWNSGTESDKDIARSRKRRLNYMSNIMVISDPKNPENEGKVFLYKYGKKIFDKVQEVLSPEFDDETPINPFDFWKGADFKLKIRTIANFVNYDKSEFDSVSELFDGDDTKLEEVYNSQHKLQPLVAKDQFKSFDELKARMTMVLTGGNRNVATAEDVGEANGNGAAQAENAFGSGGGNSEEASAPTASKSDGGEEDDALSYFEKLANED